MSKKDAAPAEAGPPEMVDVKVLAYKIRTSSGRLIEGQIHPLPKAEAEALAASGAVEVVS